MQGMGWIVERRQMSCRQCGHAQLFYSMTATVLGLPSMSILNPGILLFRKPAKTQGKQPVSEKNDG